MTKQDWIFIIVVIFVSTIIRFSNFLDSANILSDATPIIKSMLSLGFADVNVFTIFHAKLGQSFLETSLKSQLLPILMGVACIPLFFSFLKRIASPASARAGVLLFSFSFWHMTLSRFAPEISFIFFLTVLGSYLSWLAMQKGSVLITAIVALFIGFIFNFAFIAWPVAVAMIIVFIMFNSFHERYDNTLTITHTKFHLNKLFGVFGIVLILGLIPLILRLDTQGYKFVDSILASSVFVNENYLSLIYSNFFQIINNLGLGLEFFANGGSHAGILSQVLGILFVIGLVHSLFRVYKHKQKYNYAPLGHIFLFRLMAPALFFGLLLEPKLAGLSFVSLAIVPVFAYIGMAIGWLHDRMVKIPESRALNLIYPSSNIMPRIAIMIFLVAISIYDISRFLELVYYAY